MKEMLKELGYLDAEQIEKIAKMKLSQEGEILEMCPKTAEWVRDCYNKPCFLNIKLMGVMEIGDWSGVMALKKEGTSDVWYEVMNAGDTYASTLAFDMRKREWLATSWGDLIEKAEIEEGVVLETF